MIKIEVNSKIEVKIRSYGNLRKILGTEIILKLRNNTNIDTLISKLSNMTHAFKKDYISTYKVGSNLSVLINGRNKDSIRKTIYLNEGDLIELVPYAVGG